MAWPRITLITATLDRGGWLKTMLQSVAAQNYPNLEFFVLDGGSCDETCQQLKDRGSLVTAWVSRPDGGQAHALNEGISWATGDLVGWLNSDDVLLPGALQALGRAYAEHRCPLILANVLMRDLPRQLSWELRQRNVSLKTFREPWRYPVTWAQPGTFFTPALLQQAGPLLEDMHHLFDWEWMCRALQFATPHYLNRAVAAFHYHDNSKTSAPSQGWMQDKRRIVELHAPPAVRRRAGLLRACCELSLAQDCWACHWEANRLGWTHFWRALTCNPQILRWPRTWVAAGKALLPIPLRQQLRSRLKGY